MTNLWELIVVLKTQLFSLPKIAFKTLNFSHRLALVIMACGMHMRIHLNECECVQKGALSIINPVCTVRNTYFSTLKVHRVTRFPRKALAELQNFLALCFSPKNVCNSKAENRKYSCNFYARKDITMTITFIYCSFSFFCFENAGEKPAANIAATPNKSITSSSTTTIYPTSHSPNVFRNIFCMLIVLVNLKDLIRRIL